MSLASLSTVHYPSTPFAVLDDRDDDIPDIDAFQSISGRNIDPDKLLGLLRMKFGAGTYDMHVSCTQVPPSIARNADNSPPDRAELLLRNCTPKALSGTVDHATFKIQC
jgi:hypothetical protein